MGSLTGMLVLALGLGLPCSRAFPAPPGPLEDWKFVEDYFNRFFLQSKKAHFSSLEEQMKFLQRFFHMSITGRLDAEMLGLLKQPRCGVPDMAEYSYFPGSPKWNKNLLTYRILNYPPGLSKRTVGAVIDRALSVWSDVTPLMFQRIDDQEADMDIAFWRGGANLFLVATHELGHALGLSHSGNSDSIMFPHYHYVDLDDFRLSRDDVRGIQRLYGRRKNF
ncbi:matrix metalloproteinase-26-like isoform X2 [Ornithorhynchus anatinus]|uniref:matrix metalloproteinase-26-like isoform X2 n=1 Tax=Ornithorhynchus anatinus TaxID=9258 RepID=UPI0010A7D15E|nr:matrix metalloproteinase-26-like isoform X2 [Ornithorhynchus anatinus]